ncbi:YadA-like family protein, partial [Psychrobacter aquimaris]|uniref:YadA-like family protein n=1 Tax=Psychrobacter aquimaris TaxID=292733 RepID=UPI0039C5CFCC
VSGQAATEDQLKSVSDVANTGWDVSANGTTGENVAPGDKVDFTGDSNITVAQTGTDLKFNLNKDLDVTSVKTGNSKLDNSGLFVTNGDPINPETTTVGAGSITLTGGSNSDVVLSNNGLDNGGNKITNVAAGTIGLGSTDAVNGGQIQAAGDSLATNVLGGNAEYVNNSFTMSDVGGTGQSTIDEAIKSVNTTANAGWNVSGSGVNEVNIGPNGKVDFIGDSNITVAQTGLEDDGKIGINLNPDLDVTSVKTGNSKLDNSGLSVTNGTYTSSVGATQIVAGGINPVTVNGTTGTVNGLTNTTWDPVNQPIVSGQAATEDQLKVVSDVANTGWDVSANGTTGENVAPGAKVDFSNTDDNIVIAQTGTDLEFNLNPDLDVTSVKTGNSLLNNNGLTIVGGPSITQSGIDAGGKVITGVASGVGSDTNAANIGDLKNAVTGVTNAGLSFKGDRGIAINRKLGETLNITGGAATGAVLTTGNIGIRNDGSDGLIVELAEKVDLGTDGSVKAGVTIIDNTGLTIVGGPSITQSGIDAGGKVIIGVADGLVATGSKEAINGGQLFGTANSVANNFGGGSKVNDNGTISAPKYELNNGVDIYDNVGDALGGLDDRVSANADNITNITNGTAGIVRQDPTTEDITVGSQTGGNSVDFSGIDGNRVLTGVADGKVELGSKDAVNGGQLHSLGSDVAGIIGGEATYDVNGNLTANNIGGTGKGNINDAIASINQGNAQANEDIKVNADNIQANIDRLDSGLSFGADTGDNINKPIGDSSALKFEGSNNITTSATGNSIKFDLNGNISVDSVTADSVTTGNTTVNTNGITIKDGPSMTTDGINAGDKAITGVADGIEVNDAVNFGQLNALDGKLSNSVNELGYKINEVEDDANAGISAAMAMSSLPQAYIPGKSMVGGGIATYNGQSAVAIGVSKVSDNGRWVIKVNGTADTQGNAGGAVGAGFHF